MVHLDWVLFGEDGQGFVCYKEAFVFCIFLVIFSDRKLTPLFIGLCAASACLCGCFFAFISPGDGCAYVGGYQPTGLLHLSVELLRVTVVCG